MDGQKIGTLNHGETQEYAVRNGKHEVYAKLGWERSQKIELDITENEIIVLELTQYPYGTLILFIFFGLQFLYILGKDTLNFEFKYYLILMALIISHPVYYLLNNKSVVLTEIYRN